MTLLMYVIVTQTEQDISKMMIITCWKLKNMFAFLGLCLSCKYIINTLVIFLLSFLTLLVLDSDNVITRDQQNKSLTVILIHIKYV